jgi:hypothetical protein
MVGMTDLYGCILGFLDRSNYFFFQVAPQLYSGGLADPVQTYYFSENLVAQTFEFVAGNSDH